MAIVRETRNIRLLSWYRTKYLISDISAGLIKVRGLYITSVLPHMSGMTLPRCCLSTDCPVCAQCKPRCPGETSVTGESLVTSTELHNNRQHVTLNIYTENTIWQDDKNIYVCVVNSPQTLNSVIWSPSLFQSTSRKSSWTSTRTSSRTTPRIPPRTSSLNLISLHDQMNTSVW